MSDNTPPVDPYQGHFGRRLPTWMQGIAATGGPVSPSTLAAIDKLLDETAAPCDVEPAPQSAPRPDQVDRGAASILREAAEIVEGARNATHGDKERSFTRIAALWSVYLDRDLTARDVALMMVLLKIGRAISGKPVRDHFVDMAGYSAIGGEL